MIAVPVYGVPPYTLVTAGGRLGARILDVVLIMVTLGIGWLIWALITWANGQTPGKALLGHVVADARTGEPFGWGRMCVREFLVKGLLFGLLSMVTCGLSALVDCLMVLRSDQRTLHDLVVGSVVCRRG